MGIELIALAAVAISAAAAGYGAYSSSQQQQFASKMANRNAKQAELTAAAQAENQAREDTRRQGLIRAQYSASGVSRDGTPLDVLGDNAMAAESNRLTILYGGQVNAENDRLRARALSGAATATAISGYGKAGSTLLGGSYDAYQAGVFG